MISLASRSTRLLLAISLGAITGAAQQQKGSVDPDALVKWESTCGARGCLMQTDVLRGVSDDPPDAKDFREYIGLDVALDRSLSRPAYFSFLVDPRAQADQGIFITFAKTTQEKDQMKLNLDPEGPSKLTIGECSKNACTARVPLGMVPEGKDGRKVDLLDKFLNSDHLLVLYMRNGRPYRTMVILSSFKKEYGRLMATEMKDRKSDK